MPIIFAVLALLVASLGYGATPAARTGSTYGYYLEALVIFGNLTGRDPRTLGPRERAAALLGVAPPLATQLQKIAAETLATEAHTH